MQTILFPDKTPYLGVDSSGDGVVHLAVQLGKSVCCNDEQPNELKVRKFARPRVHSAVIYQSADNLGTAALVYAYWRMKEIDRCI